MLPEQKYLLKDLRLNTVTDCSIDEAVGIMLGIWKVDCYLDVLQIDREFSFPNKYQSFEFNLSDYLYEERDALQNAYTEAKIEKLSANEQQDGTHIESEQQEFKEAVDIQLESYLEEIEKFDTNYMKKAKKYLCLIENELSKGSLSTLRINNIHDRRINLASLDEWCNQFLDDKQSIFDDIKQNEINNKKESLEDEDLRLNANVTFGLLLHAYIYDHIDKGVHKFGEADDANISAVHFKLSKLLKQNNISPEGQSTRSITSRLTAAQKAFQKFINDSSKFGKK
jgi:hypothetical protein